MKRTDLLLDWKLRYALREDPEVFREIPAVVPGAVQLDIARAEGYGPHAFGQNWKDYLWMEDCSFTYFSEFGLPEMEQGEHLRFRALGIDYSFEIRLNGEYVYRQEGMFRAVDLDLSGFLQQENRIEIKIFPAPKKQNEPVDHRQAADSCKPAVSYGWDWHPRLIPMGIWDECWLEVLPSSCFEFFSFRYELQKDPDIAHMLLDFVVDLQEDDQLRWEFRDAEGWLIRDEEFRPAGGRSGFVTDLVHPRLWWPHDHGTPYLYSYCLQIVDGRGRVLDERKGRVGFRSVKLVMNTGAWDEPTGFPKTRSVPPIQLEVNGRRVFAKGSNWVSPEIFPGLFTRERYRELLELAKGSNFNLLRIWGGSPVNKESFYELCDEMGLMVWQEFPLACNNYESDVAYLEVLDQEARAIVSRISRHACLAMWSGGNELFNEWSGMDDQSLALRLLNSICLELDIHTPFIPTSPLYGMGHGHYVFRDRESGEEVYALMKRSRCSAYTEFGMPSPASPEILREIIPEEELWPPRPGTSWEGHHAYNAWIADSWLMQDVIEGYFGPLDSLEELSDKGQLLQSEGYKTIYEEARRQKPYCSMALSWCFNEPWPTAANNSLVAYPARPKPALNAVAASCRPVLLSARNIQFAWKADEDFRCQLFFLNDTPREQKGGTARAWLEQDGHRIALGSWEYGAAGPDSNLEGPELKVSLKGGGRVGDPRLKPGLFQLHVQDPADPALASRYSFVFLG